MTRTAHLESFDPKLLEILQQQIPLVERPFAAASRRLEMSEAEVLQRIVELSSPPRAIIRQISAIFDSGALGYRSCLVAARVDQAQVEQAADVVSRHPGVSHNYQRTHSYNLWFTLAVGPDSTLGLERTVEILKQQTGAAAMRLLPSLKLYKIGVKFDLSGEADYAARSEPPSQLRTPTAFVATERDKRLIRALQQNLPLVPEPFDILAKEAGVEIAALLDAAEDYLRRGVMRRFAAVLRHRHAGFAANAMGVWAVPAGREDVFGAIAATFNAVSHCYRRPTFDDWPYSVFTMVHGTSREACEGVLAEIARVTGVGEYAALYSSREFKKVRLKYFTPDISAWEAEVRLP